MASLWRTDLPVWNLAVRAGVVYLAVLVLLRLAGKRQVGQMGAGELVALLLISNAVQNSMNGGDNSLAGGLLLAAVILALSWAVGRLSYLWPRFETLVAGRPSLLVHHGKLVPHNLRRERLNARDLHALLREQGIHDVSEIEEAVLESNGRLSVIRKGEKQAKG